MNNSKSYDERWTVIKQILAVGALFIIFATTQAADVVLQGDESRLFIRQIDGAQLIEFNGSIANRTDVAGLDCDTSTGTVAIIGPEGERNVFIAMMLVSQASNVPVRVFIDDRPGFGNVCTVETIRMGKLPL